MTVVPNRDTLRCPVRHAAPGRRASGVPSRLAQAGGSLRSPTAPAVARRSAAPFYGALWRTGQRSVAAVAETAVALSYAQVFPGEPKQGPESATMHSS